MYLYPGLTLCICTLVSLCLCICHQVSHCLCFCRQVSLCLSICSQVSLSVYLSPGVTLSVYVARCHLVYVSVVRYHHVCLSVDRCHSVCVSVARCNSVYVFVVSMYVYLCHCLYICRNNSTKDLESFAETAISINRMMQQHLHMSLSRAPQHYISHSDMADGRRRVDSTSTLSPDSYSSTASDDHSFLGLLDSLQVNMDLSHSGDSSLVQHHSLQQLSMKHHCRMSDSGDSFSLVLGSWRN